MEISNNRIRELYHSLNKEEQAKFLKSLSPSEFKDFYYSNLMLLPYQVVPDGNWRYCIFLGGRGTGKTETGAHWIYDKIKEGATKVAIIAPTYLDLSKIMVPALLNRFPPDQKPKFLSGSSNLIKCKNGVEIHCLTFDNESARGGNYEYVWIDEIVKACDAIPEKIEERFISVIDPAVRIGKAQIYISTTPKPFPILIKWNERFQKGDPLVHIKSATTKDNPYLAQVAKDALYSQYGDTRLGMQELEAQLLTDIIGALWTNNMIEKDRITAQYYNDNVKIERVVVGVDPSVTDGTDSDYTGIIVAGYSKGHAYVLADYSIKASPNVWAKEVVKAYETFGATKVVAEINQGGDLVTETIRSISKNIPIKTIHAKKAKLTRAEPVAALYEQNKVSHVGFFKNLEYEMTSYNGNPKMKSPDRMDALVYAVSELLIQPVYTNRNFDVVGVY